jgi:thymidylate synthase (FAD)
MRHRIGFSYNEESGRYRELQPVFYIPAEDRKLVQEGRPGKYVFVEGTEEQKTEVRDLLMENSNECYWMYRTLLDAGVAKEVARMALPLNIYSSMYVTCNARSLMHFLGLRTTHPQAKVPSFPQREIEMVAEQMEARWAEKMPLTYAAFNANGRVAP